MATTAPTIALVVCVFIFRSVLLVGFVSQVFGGREGDDAAFLADGIVEMIDDALVLDDCQEFAFGGRPQKEPLGRTGGRGK
jgi:hypothetical protein